jgi:tRNA(Ile)-lysidine synthase TilS/MesJ
MKKYNVWIRSVPGFFAQYDGKVTVFAENEDDAVERAFNKLKRGAFPDRSRDMWKVDKVERVHD